MSGQTLSPRTRSHLRALAHDLAPVVQVGADGLTDALVAAIDTALEHHELVKIKLGQSFVGERKGTGDELAEATKSALVQVIGRVVVLYRRRRKDDPKRPRIELPA